MERDRKILRVRNVTIRYISIPLLAFCQNIAWCPADAQAQDSGGQVPGYSGALQQSDVQGDAAEQTIFLPTGDLFKPLLADPMEPRFYLSYRIFKFQSSKIHEQ